MQHENALENEEAIPAERAGNAERVERPRAKERPETQERLWTPLFVMIIIATFCAYMVGQGANAGTSVYVEVIGGSLTLAGIGAAVFSGAAAVARLILGPVIDSKGRIVVMIFGGFFLIAGTLGPTFVTDSNFLLLWRLIQGIGFAATTTASATAVADILPAARLGEGIGYHGLGQALAMAVGPALAIFLVHTDPAENLFLGLSAAAVLSLVFSLFCRYEKDPAKLPKTSAARMQWEKRQREAAAAAAESTEGRQAAKSDEKPHVPFFHPSSFFERRALPGTIPMLMLTPVLGFNIYFAGVMGSSLGFSNAGLYYTFTAVSMIVVRLNSKRFMDTVAPIKLKTICIAFGLVGYGLLTASSLQVLPPDANEWMFYLAGLVYGVFLGICLPLNQTVAVKNTPSERWGAANALYLLSMDVGIGIVCIIWGMINDTMGYTIAIIAAMMFMVLAYIAAWICYPAHDKRWH